MTQPHDLRTLDDASGAAVCHINPSASQHPAHIEAINFTVTHDDGQSDHDLHQADVILIGVSGSGKTFLSLHLAMHHGIKAANFPLVPEDFDRLALPAVLRAHSHQLWGLSLTPERLSTRREQRRPHTPYAALDNCHDEVRQAEAMMRRSGIRRLTTANPSVEALVTAILLALQPKRLRC